MTTAYSRINNTLHPSISDPSFILLNYMIKIIELPRPLTRFLILRIVSEILWLLCWPPECWSSIKHNLVRIHISTITMDYLPFGIFLEFKMLVYNGCEGSSVWLYFIFKCCGTITWFRELSLGGLECKNAANTYPHWSGSYSSRSLRVSPFVFSPPF